MARPPRDPSSAGAKIAGAKRRIRKRGHASVDTPGVPNAVGRPQSHGRPGAHDGRGDDARVVWLLDLLAHARWGQVTPRPDLRGVRGPLPPIVLPDAVDPAAGRDPAADGDPAAAPETSSGLVVALEPLSAVARLRSRKRAFSQIAGRYSALLVGAKDAGAALHITWWNVGGEDHGLSPAVDDATWAEPLLAKLQTFLGESGVAVRLELCGPEDARALLESAGPIPAELAARNPLAWWRAS